MTAFYQRLLGLGALTGDGESVTLGAGGGALLHLRGDPAARLGVAALSRGCFTPPS